MYIIMTTFPSQKNQFLYNKGTSFLTLYDKFAWPLFGSDDVESGGDLPDVDNGLVGFIGSWNRQF